MSLVAVEAVDVFPLARDHLQGFGLDSPKPGDTIDTHTLPLEGWLLGKSGHAKSIEVLHEGQPVLRIPVGASRADLTDAFPEFEEAGTSGFSGAVGALRLRSNFELLLRGELDNGIHAPLASIKGSRRSVDVPGEEGPRPLIVTTLGRTGSTWCVWLLQSHPEVVAQSPFENDARVGSYWMSVLQSLSDPTSYLCQIYPGDVTGNDWWIEGQGGMPSRASDAALDSWLGNPRILELAGSCRDRINSFYEFVASAQEKQATYFVEKYLPRQIPTELLREVYPGSREVVLVRDLRDVFCSILAFNRKRGYNAFGREQSESDDAYVDSVRRSGEALLGHMRSRAGKTHLVRYEDLIREPVQTLEPLLEFLDLDPSAAPSMLEHASIATPGMDHHMTAPSAADSIGRWRRDLEPSLVERCDEVLSPVVAEFGYETTGSDAAGT